MRDAMTALPALHGTQPAKRARLLLRRHSRGHNSQDVELLPGILPPGCWEGACRAGGCTSTGGYPCGRTCSMARHLGPCAGRALQAGLQPAAACPPRTVEPAALGAQLVQGVQVARLAPSTRQGAGEQSAANCERGQGWQLPLGWECACGGGGAHRRVAKAIYSVSASSRKARH